MSSTNTPYTTTEQAVLLSVAATSIRHGLAHGSAYQPDIYRFDELLQKQGASFVTLTIQGNLRGCIGMLNAIRPLVSDVANNAYAAAFEDPRFPSLNPKEYAKLDIHISILSEPEPMQFKDENDLLSQIRPGIDGLILQEGFKRGTFLPSVWESLPDRREFLNHLKQKAGLPVGYWSSQIKMERYTTFSFGDLSKNIKADAFDFV